VLLKFVVFLNLNKSTNFPDLSSSSYSNIFPRVNCPFFFKIGACRHGDRCTRLHHRPTYSQTVLLAHMYNPPEGALNPKQTGAQNKMDREVQAYFEHFYEVFDEFLRNAAS